MVDKISFTVSEDHVGERLDKFLVSKMPDFSRSEIQKFDVLVLDQHVFH